MTKAGAGSDDRNPGEGRPIEDGPSPELVERFRQLEAGVDEAVSLIGELKRQKRELEDGLAEAARRIDALLDKIDSLL